MLFASRGPAASRLSRAPGERSRIPHPDVPCADVERAPWVLPLEVQRDRFSTTRPRIAQMNTPHPTLFAGPLPPLPPRDANPALAKHQKTA